MGIFSGIVVFVIVWWVVFFAVLPWGIRQQANTGPGQDPGAPVNPRLWTKAGVTTLVTALIWIIIHFVIEADLIRFGPGTPIQ